MTLARPPMTGATLRIADNRVPVPNRDEAGREPLLTRWRRVAVRMLGFAAIGATGIGVNTLALWLLVDYVGLHYLIGAGLATQVSTAWNFVLTDAVLYGRHRRGHWARRFIPFTLISNASLLVRLPLLALLVDVMALHYLIGNVLVLFAVFLGRFVACDRFIYRRRATTADRQP